MLVPRTVEGRTSGIKPFFLCDDGRYLFNAVSGGDERKHLESLKFHTEVLSRCEDDDGAQAALAFLESSHLQKDNSGNNAKVGAVEGNMVLCLEHASAPIFRRSAIVHAWLDYLNNGGNGGKSVYGRCCVKGEYGKLARIFTNIKGVSKSPSSLVSCNFEASESYGKTKTYNASISEDVAFRAGTALKYLLADRSRKVTLGGTIMTYWTDAPAPVADATLGWLFRKGTGNLAEDKPTRDALSSALEEMKSGRVPTSFDPEVGYCLLGVSPNNARLAVRYFVRGTLGDLARILGDYAKDIKMVGVEGFTAPWQILLQISPDGKQGSRPYERLKKTPQTMVAQAMQAVFEGGEFPRALETLVLARMRTDHGDKGRWDLGQRAAILKACRNRRLRLRGLYPKEKERIEVSLNKKNSNLGYLTGRLFAVLERAQQGAVEDAKATIRDRYIGAASTTPARVMQPLLRLCQAHLASIRKDEKKIWLANRLERELDEIVGRLMPGDGGFPKTLDSDDQGMFFIGYYQERCSLWEKSDKNTPDDAASGELLNEAGTDDHSEEE